MCEWSPTGPALRQVRDYTFSLPGSMAPIYLSELRAELSEVGTPVSCTTQHYDPGQFSIHELLIQS